MGREGTEGFGVRDQGRHLTSGNFRDNCHHASGSDDRKSASCKLFACRHFRALYRSRRSGEQEEGEREP